MQQARYFFGLARDCCGGLNKNASEPSIAAKRVGFDNPRYVAEWFFMFQVKRTRIFDEISICSMYEVCIFRSIPSGERLHLAMENSPIFHGKIHYKIYFYGHFQ